MIIFQQQGSNFTKAFRNFALACFILEMVGTYQQLKKREIKTGLKLALSWEKT